MIEKGIVKAYSASTGTGTVTRANGEVMTILKKHFQPGLESLQAGDAISYDVVMGMSGLTAKNVQKAD